MSGEYIKNSTKDTMIKYYEIIFDLNSRLCAKCSDELWKQQVIDKNKYTIKGLWMIQ